MSLALWTGVVVECIDPGGSQDKMGEVWRCEVTSYYPGLSEFSIYTTGSCIVIIGHACWRISMHLHASTGV